MPGDLVDLFRWRALSPANSQVAKRRCSMQVNITGLHLEITDALRDYVEEKFDRLERHFDRIIAVQVMTCWSTSSTVSSSSTKKNSSTITRAPLLADPIMIRIENILTPGRSLVNVPGGSKKRVLEQIAKVLGQDLPDLDSQTIFESFIAREKLGSTGFGNGIAIPHCRMPGCTSPLSAVLRLDVPVDFDAIDGAPVDLLFVLLVPEAATDEHLELLRQIASMLDREDVRERLRRASTGQELYQAVVDIQSGR